MTGNSDQFDENLKRMLESALDQPRPAFQERLVRDVLEEVAQQRKLEGAEVGEKAAGIMVGAVGKEGLPHGSLGDSRALLARWFGAGRWGKRLTYAGAAAAAVVLVATGIWGLTSPASRTVGEISCLYGMVAVQNNGASRAVSEAIALSSGQRIKTQTGSKAQILLQDKSKLIPDPRTSLQIANTSRGPRILLEKGTIRLEATKQPPGKAITIEASHAQVKVLGTKLDVRLVEKPSGTRQTRVRVLSGRVEMESGGQKVLLLPGTEGIADENQPPVRESVVFEVNELARLFKQTEALAAKSGRRQGLPAIIDFTAATVWSVVPSRDLKPAGPGAYALRLKYPAFAAKAYTLEGAELPTQGRGKELHVELPATESARIPEYLILKVPGVGGLLKTTEDGLTECSFPAGDTELPSLIQLHLPEAALVQNVEPPAVERTLERNRLIITVAARIRLPQLYE